MRKRFVWLFAVIAVALFAAAALVLLVTATDAVRPWLDEVSQLIDQVNRVTPTPPPTPTPEPSPTPGLR